MEIHRGPSRKITRIQYRRHSDWHAHARVDALMQAVAWIIMRNLRHVLLMPNNGPIRTIADGVAYYDKARGIAEAHTDREIGIIITLYHTKDITSRVIEHMARHPYIRAVKHYPPIPNLTTGSGLGVPLEQSGEMLRAMEVNGVPLCGHFEEGFDQTGRPLSPQEGEAYMVREKLWRVRDTYPNLKISFEHGSTKEGVEFVKADTSGRTVMTITPHHMLFTDRDFERFGPHLKCKPAVQTEENRLAVAKFAMSGDPRAIAGGDTAPHPRKTKEIKLEGVCGTPDTPWSNLDLAKASNGCWLPHAIALYAKAFIDAGAMGPNFEKFTSLNGPEWWNVPPPDEDDLVTLVAEPQNDLPDPVAIPGMDDVVVPLGWTGDAHRLRPGFVIE